MKTVLVVLSFAFAVASVAAEKTAPVVYYYGGKPVTSEAALRALLQGGDVLGCRPVEAKASKSGTSIGIRNKKVTVN